MGPRDPNTDLPPHQACPEQHGQSDLGWVGPRVEDVGQGPDQLGSRARTDAPAPPPPYQSGRPGRPGSPGGPGLFGGQVSGWDSSKGSPWLRRQGVATSAAGYRTTSIVACPPGLGRGLDAQSQPRAGWGGQLPQDGNDERDRQQRGTRPRPEACDYNAPRGTGECRKVATIGCEGDGGHPLLGCELRFCTTHGQRVARCGCLMTDQAGTDDDQGRLRRRLFIISAVRVIRIISPFGFHA